MQKPSAGVKGLSAFGLRKRFGGHVILKDAGFEWPENGLVAILGGNGAGKTVLLNILSGFEPADSGTLTWHGHNIASRSPLWRATRGFAYMFQTPAVIGDLDWDEHIAYALRGNLEPPASRTSLSAQVFTNSLKALIGSNSEQPAKLFSFGQRKLLNLACAIVRTSSIMLLDEPFAGLSDNAVERVRSIIHNFQSRVLVVLVDHDRERVDAMADLCVQLENGLLSTVSR